jgi:hypothetical protein
LKRKARRKDDDVRETTIKGKIKANLGEKSTLKKIKGKKRKDWF